MSTRREILLGSAGILLAPLAARAQPAKKLPHIGVIALYVPSMEELARSPFPEKLAELGWQNGVNCEIEGLFADGDVGRLDTLAAQLIGKSVDVIVAVGPQAAIAAAKATRAIPIVFTAVNFPVELGLVPSLARPGGNVTGTTWTTGPEFYTKLLEYLKALVPKASKVAGLSSPSSLTDMSGKVFDMAPIMQSAAHRLGIERKSFHVQKSEDFPQAFADIAKWRPHALAISGDPITYPERIRVVEFAAKHRLPAVYGMKEFALAGGLLSYSVNSADLVRHTAVYVNRVLRGAKPAELPVEQPTRFELVVNLKTARTFGIKIAQSILIRADQVIE